jgi:SAM-dependent methyltransferase
MVTRVTEIQHLQMNCDRIGPYYQLLEYLCFGRSLERRRFAFLGETKGSQRAIVCGGGDGRFLARLLRVNARAQVDFVDLSPVMIDLAQRRIAGMGRTFCARVSFHVGDIREFQARPEGYDLIVTHFFLDCFSRSEIRSLVSYVAGWAAPGALWILSEFSEAEGPIGHIWTRAIISGLYAAFRLTGLQLTRLSDYSAALLEAAFECKSVEYSRGGLLQSSLWEKAH